MLRIAMLIAVATALLLSPVTVQGQSPRHFFQLVAQDNTCLQILDAYGTFTHCKDTRGYGFSPNTVFLQNGDKPGYLNIEIFGIALCLDREHCHSSTSNLRYSDCNHCGAIHWSIISDGSVREDSNKNCIYRDSNGHASVRHCSDGFEKFTVRSIGNRFLLKSSRHGDCVAGDKFTNCDSAPTFYTSDLPGDYKLHSSLNPNTCLDREHCHSSTSNVRLYDCTHCGAIHWSIAYENKVGEDEMKNCVNRDPNNALVMKHCSDGYEPIYYSIIPSQPATAMQVVDDTDAPRFPIPNVNTYLHWNLSQRIRGAKLFKYVYNGQATCELEIVHYLPNTVPYYGQYTAEYMVTHIHTNILYEPYLTIGFVMGRIATYNTRITQYNIRYGMVDTMWQHFGNFDRLYSLFVTNPSGVRVTAYTSSTINQLQWGLQQGTYNWNQYYENVYPGWNGSPQRHCDLFNGYNHAALYWPYTFYSGSQLDEQERNETVSDEGKRLYYDSVPHLENKNKL